MKKYLNLSFVLLFSVISLVLASCGNDDNEGVRSVEGTWVSESSNASVTNYCRFMNGGKYIAVTVSIIDGAQRVNVSETGWSQKGKELMVGAYDATIIKVTDTELVIISMGNQISYRKCSASEMDQYLY